MTTAMLKRRPHLIPCLCAAGLLVAALGEWPDAYFTLVHWGVCAAAVFVGYKSYRWQALWGAWVFGFIALFFNPYIPVDLPRNIPRLGPGSRTMFVPGGIGLTSQDIWILIELAVAASFLVAAVLLRQPEVPETEEGD